MGYASQLLPTKFGFRIVNFRLLGDFRLNRKPVARRDFRLRLALENTSPPSPPVPGLTGATKIKANNTHWLFGEIDRGNFRCTRKLLLGLTDKVASVHTARGDFVTRPKTGKISMRELEGQTTDPWDLDPRPAWTHVWHLWRVFVPRRTITGKLACGKVWRRHNGRHWIYKSYAQPLEE